MNRVLPATAIVAAAMFSGASGASAAPPAPLASSAAKDFSQIEKIYDRGTYRVRRYYRYGYDGPVYYRRPAYRYYYGEPYYYGPPYVSVGVPFFSLSIGPDRRYYHRRYDGRHFYADW